MQQPEDYLYEEYKKEQALINAEKEWLFYNEDLEIEKKKKNTRIIVKFEDKVINLKEKEYDTTN
jgi:hypothetical protein